MSTSVWTYYNSLTPPTAPGLVDKNWVAYYGGIDPDTSTPEELAAAGFYEYIETPPPEYNPAIYTLDFTWVITGTTATKSYTLVALPLPESKATFTSQVNSTAYYILLPSDWLVVRKVENGTEIPANWNAWREEIRVEAQNKVDAVDACTTSDELSTYVSSPAYAYWAPNPVAPPQVLANG